MDFVLNDKLMSLLIPKESLIGSKGVACWVPHRQAPRMAEVYRLEDEQEAQAFRDRWLFE